MEDKTKIIISAGMILTLALAVSGTYFLSQDDDAYYCESKDIVMICEKLSSGTGSRCYFDETYKICPEGWHKIELDQEISIQAPGDSVPVPIPASSEGIKWECSPEECIRIE